jgi:16S rRNA (adenine1518-N6/adenine1519-N6)-dimethyltransferase
MNKESLISLLKKYNLKPNFTYGQNFLIDEFALQDIVDAAEITKEDCVLEIGPGIGNLTELLLQRAGMVLSVEKDPKFLPILKRLKKQYPNFRYEIADALEFNFQDVFKARGCESYKVVANIPYYITGKITQMLLTANLKPATITMLTQREVGQNLQAKPGNMNILAISVQIFGDVKLVQKVLARSFYPAPKVDSAVVQIKLYKKPKHGIADEKKFFSLVKSCFAGKRKQLHNTLANTLHVSKSEAVAILERLKINPAARPQELSIEQWIELTNYIK